MIGNACSLNNNLQTRINSHFSRFCEGEFMRVLLSSEMDVLKSLCKCQVPSRVNSLPIQQTLKEKNLKTLR